MKKSFFTALVVVAAIGGAYAQYVDDDLKHFPQFDCNGTIVPFCTYPTYYPDSFFPIPLSDTIYTSTQVW